MHQHSDPMFIGALITSLLVLTASAGAEPGANDAERGWQLAQVQPQQGQRVNITLNLLQQQQLPIHQYGRQGHHQFCCQQLQDLYQRQLL